MIGVYSYQIPDAKDAMTFIGNVDVEEGDKEYEMEQQELMQKLLNTGILDVNVAEVTDARPLPSIMDDEGIDVQERIRMVKKSRNVIRQKGRPRHIIVASNHGESMGLGATLMFMTIDCAEVYAVLNVPEFVQH